MQQAINVVERALGWFNAVMSKSGHVITREDIERQFTPDAKMIANGQVKCTGIDGHLKHFRELQAKLASFRIRLPLEQTVSSSERAAAYYLIDYKTVDGFAGVIHDSAIWEIRDQKLALMVETVHFEGRIVALENHD